MSKNCSENKGKMVTGWKKMTEERKRIGRQRDLNKDAWTPFRGRQRDLNKDAWTPFRGMFCLKRRQDMKIVEEKEDCFILDFDPNDSFDAENLSSTSILDGDEDVVIIHEKGEVACRDFPHSRHLCAKYPFGSTQHSIHCDKCYCYVCDLPAPCDYWTSVHSAHCEAIEDDTWKHIRAYHRNLADQLVASNK